VRGIAPLTLALTGFSFDKESNAWRDASIELLAADTAEAAARRAMMYMGRDPETEFSLTSRRFIATLFCLDARQVGGGGRNEYPEWLAEGSEQ
jgi:hypothetical protein